MSKTLLLILLIVALGALLGFVVLEQKLFAAAVTPKGADVSSIAQYVALATSIVSLVTAIIGLLRSPKR
jgi:hypothetical protein